MTVAQYGFPSLVGCSVMSVSHSRFGLGVANSRLTRSSAALLRVSHGAAPASASVQALDAGFVHEPGHSPVVDVHTRHSPSATPSVPRQAHRDVETVSARSRTSG